MKLIRSKCLALGVFFVVIFSNLKAQNFSFNCSRDTIVAGCPTNLCITLKSLIPDIKGLSSSYTLNPGSTIPGCFPVYVAPNDPAGTPTNLTIDDRYSGIIALSFPFAFYGTTYTSLVASTNGYISFDVSLANGTSHWQNRGDLPNTLYDRALVMGPYHDLDPSLNTSPLKRIQYQEWGVAPARRWVLSFFKVPLFNCGSLIENTHQIILYESTGIIEVKIFDKQICGAWNAGKAMVGIQDFNRTQGMTAPNRRMSDPPWGSIGMNETWRFVPDAGTSLLKRVELLDMAGNIITTGTTAPYSAGVLEASFPNICAPAGGITSYQVRSVYEKNDDPTVEIFGLDTVRINRANPLNATATATPAACGTPNGTITATVTGGGTPPYEYSLDGTNWQTSNIFTGLAAGTYTVYIRDNGAVCTMTIPGLVVGVSGTIPATTSTTPTACTGVNNGTITVTSAGGTGPYTFSLDGGPPIAGTIPYTFTNVSAGSHTVLVNDLGTGCNSGSITVPVSTGVGVSGTYTSTPTACAGLNTGTITVTALTGTAPFTWSLDGGPFVPGASPYTFTNLFGGPHFVTIRDNFNCSILVPADVPFGTGVSGSAVSTGTSCTGVNDGTITVTAITGIPPFTWSLDGGPFVPGASPYTFTNVAAGSHTVTIRDNVGCMILVPAPPVTAGPTPTATISSTATACAGVNNGTITISAVSIAGPYTFSIDGGAPVAGTLPFTFSNLSAGVHNIVVTGAAGCATNSTPVPVATGAGVTGTASSTATSCNTASNGTITVTALTGTAPYTWSLNGGPPQNGASPYTFTNLTAGTYNVLITDNFGCTHTVTNIPVTAGPALTTTVSSTDVLCNGGNTGIITVAVPTMGTPPYEYSLDGITWQSSNVFNGLIAGPYTAYYRESSGCQGQQTINVNEPAALTASDAVVAATCNGANDGTITLTPGGGITPYEYSIDGGANWQSSNVFTVGAGPYIITIRDANGCTTTRNVNVTEPPLLTASSVNTSASCNGGNDGIITVTANGGNPGGYQYSIDNINWQSSNVFNVAPNSYTVYVRDNLGCNTNFPAIVGLSNNLTFVPQVDPTICEGSSTQLNLVSNATVYTWTPSTGLSNPNIANPVANPTVTTPYTVTATLDRCSITDIVIVNVNPAPIPNAGSDAFICFGQDYQLQASGGVQYSWTPATYLDNPSLPSPTSSARQTIRYTLSIIADVNGCPSLVTDDMVLDVTPPIKVYTYPMDTIAYPGEQIQFKAISAVPAANIFTWTPGTNLDNAGVSNPTVTAGNIGDSLVYKVTAMSAAGCIGEGYVRFRVYKGPDLYVPNAFTPNGDGKNETFYPFPVGIKAINYFRVYNRWGQLVFSSNTLYKGWDGRFNGTEQGTGTYVWMGQGVDKNNRLITRQGTVTLIR